MFKKILPSLPEENSFEFLILKNKKNIAQIINSIDFTNIENSYIAEELNTSIEALCSKIAAFGLDNDIYSKFEMLELESDSFKILLTKISSLDSSDSRTIKDLIAVLETIEFNINPEKKVSFPL